MIEFVDSSKDVGFYFVFVDEDTDVSVGRVVVLLFPCGVLGVKLCYLTCTGESDDGVVRFLCLDDDMLVRRHGDGVMDEVEAVATGLIVGESEWGICVEEDSESRDWIV